MSYEHDADDYPEDYAPDQTTLHEPYDDEAEREAHEEDLAAQNAVEDAKYDAMMPPQEEPPEGYYDERTHYDQAQEGIAALDDVEFGTGQLAEELALVQIHATLAVADALAELRAVLAGVPAKSGDPWASAGLESPTEPGALGAWLRNLSFGAILRDRNGHAWERNTGVEAGGGVQRRFPTLIYALSGVASELTDGATDLAHVAFYAPFTVLDPGAPF